MLSGVTQSIDTNFVQRFATKKFITYEVESISLNDLLVFHRAPKIIDYLSIDTEGSELEILRAFDFTQYDVHIITVEHNYNESIRYEIYQLLIENGFMKSTHVLTIGM